MNNEIPSILYKYKAFSINSLDSLINDTVYLADPASFNDPFDCQPTIITDLKDLTQLREITASLMFESQAREFVGFKNSVMNYIEYQHLSKNFNTSTVLDLSDKEFLEKSDKFRKESKKDYKEFQDSQLEKLRTDIGNYLEHIEEAFDLISDDVTIEMYEGLIKNELVSSRNVGVLSLAKENDCPLMWAHYADDHQGFCCGYRLPEGAEMFASKNKIKAVDYDSARAVSTSQLYDLVNNSSTVINIINNAIYYVKSKKWQYEMEYRMIGKLGLHKSPFILDNVYFGLRCKDSVKFSIMSALANRECPVNFYQMEEVKGGFDLKPKEIKLSDIHSLPITYVK